MSTDEELKTIEKAFLNPSYDKTIPVEERLRHFLGSYHIVLNGVKAHEPFTLENEGKPNEWCDSEDKERLIEFIRRLLDEQRKITEDTADKLFMAGYRYSSKKDVSKWRLIDEILKKK